MKPLIILLFVSSFLFGQTEIKSSRGAYLPRFNVDILNAVPADDGKTEIDIYFQFPYASLQFIKSGDKYVAGYTITIDVIDKDSEDIITTDLLEEAIETPTYEASVSKKSSKIVLRNLKLPPGEYAFKITLTDSESSKQYTTSFKKEVISSEEDIFISDILLIKSSVKIAGKEQLIPNISRLTQDIQQSLPFYFNVVSKEEKTINLHYKLVDEKEKILFEFSENQKLTAGINPIIKTITKLDLILGKHTVIITGKLNSEEIFKQKKEFRSIIKGFPASITDLDLAIRQVKFIATSDEMDVLDNDSLTYLQKKARFIAFWKSKDPDPSTPLNEILIEYYKRVEFANHKFKGYNDGWRTDMGYVYIIMGTPDSIDRNPFSSSNRPYEVWYYNRLNKRFVFVDETGFGEYRLMNYDHRDMTNFRY